MLGGRIHQVLNVGGKIGVSKITFTFAQAGEIKAQHLDTLGGQRFGDIDRRQ